MTSVSAVAIDAPVEPSAWSDRDRRYWVVAAALVLLGFALRVFHLDVPPFQHDEAIYSIFALNFKDYNFDPVYHGPTLYYIVKAVFLLFGDSDFTARMVSVAMGLITFALILGPTRRWLGARAALFAVGLHAISPVLVTYQRRILFDAFVVVLTFASVLLFHATRTAPFASRRWSGAWIGLASVLTVFLATKANAFFVIAMLGSFWVLDRLRGVGPRDWIVRLPGQVPILMFIAVSIAAACALRNEDKQRNEMMLTVVSVVASAVLWEWLRRPSEPRYGKKALASEPAKAPRLDLRALPLGRVGGTLWLGLFSAVFLYAFLFGHGYMWWQDPLETIPRYWPDVRDAMTKMLKYWGGQQQAPRLPGRHDFYLSLMIAYELPILIAFVGGVIRASRHRSPFTDLLIWWCFTSWTLYAMANEKVPWLMTHLVAPFALLAGWWLAQLRLHAGRRRLFAGACMVSAAYLLRNVSATNYERAVDNKEPMFYAFTGESFKDAFMKAIAEGDKHTGDIWIYNAWPPSWYMRHSATERPGVPIHYTEHAPEPPSPLRLVVCTEADWEQHKMSRFPDWHKWTWQKGRGVVADAGGENPHILNWPRLSWSSFRPDLFLSWFVYREAEVPDLQRPERTTFLTEWSHIPVVIATPP